MLSAPTTETKTPAARKNAPSATVARRLGSLESRRRAAAGIPGLRRLRPSALPAGVIQRHCSTTGPVDPAKACAPCAEKLRQTAPNSTLRSAVPAPNPAVPPVVASLLDSAEKPIAPPFPSAMQERFGRGGAQVRVGTGAAARSATENATKAYMFDHHVGFADDLYRPSDTAGPRLPAQALRHERGAAAKPSPAAMGAETELMLPNIQPKLTANTPGDIYELEADRVSEQVMRTPEPQLQRTCPCGGECPKCQMEQPGREHESLQTKRRHANDTGQIAAPPIVNEVLHSPGQPLDSATRAFMEPRFGHDFSQVRVHSDGTAEQSARDVNAQAYTAGHHIAFGTNQFAPGTQAGRRLIAHELAHVLQQGRGQPILQRKERPGEEFEPCGPVEWGSFWLFSGSAPGGPYINQGLVLPYDKIVPLPDPTEGFDAAEQRITFKTPSRLEQLYYDATTPIGSFQNRPQALWFICSAVETAAREVGADIARELHKIGCLTIYNCGVNWDVPLAGFSAGTASGLRVRGLIVEGFIDESRELDLDLTLINNALLLIGGLSAARAGLTRTGAGSPPTQTPPVTTEQPKPTVTIEKPKPTTTIEKPKPSATVEQPQPPTTVGKPKSTTVEPSKTEPSKTSPSVWPPKEPKPPKPSPTSPQAAEWRYERYRYDAHLAGKRPNEILPFDKWKTRYFDPVLEGGRPGRTGSPAHEADVARNNVANNLAPEPLSNGTVPDGVGVPRQEVRIRNVTIKPEGNGRVLVESDHVVYAGTMPDSAARAQVRKFRAAEPNSTIVVTDLANPSAPPLVYPPGTQPPPPGPLPPGQKPIVPFP